MTTISSKDLSPGLQVGRLTLLELAATHSRHGRAWTCRCTCGAVSSVPESIILGKRTPNCCRKNEQASHRRIDYTGQTFASLTALGFARLSTSGNSIWKYQCACGKVVEKIARRVVRGEIKSCGCMTRAMIKNTLTLPNKQQLRNSAYYTHCKTAEKRGYVTYLSQAEYESIITKPCYYCGKMSVRKNQATGAEAELNSVDRLGSESYYKMENSVPACFVCQKMKTYFTADEFINQALSIVAHQKAKG